MATYYVLRPTQWPTLTLYHLLGVSRRRVGPPTGRGKVFRISWSLQDRTHCSLPTTCVLPTAHYLLPMLTTNSLLPTAHYPPLAYCSLPTTHFSLPTLYCALPTTYCPLLTTHSLLPNAHHPLLTTHCPLLITTTAYCESFTPLACGVRIAHRLRVTALYPPSVTRLQMEAPIVSPHRWSSRRVHWRRRYLREGYSKKTPPRATTWTWVLARMWPCQAACAKGRTNFSRNGTSDSCELCTFSCLDCHRAHRLNNAPQPPPPPLCVRTSSHPPTDLLYSLCTAHHQPWR